MRRLFDAKPTKKQSANQQQQTSSQKSATNSQNASTNPQSTATNSQKTATNASIVTKPSGDPTSLTTAYVISEDNPPSENPSGYPIDTIVIDPPSGVDPGGTKTYNIDTDSLNQGYGGPDEMLRPVAYFQTPSVSSGISKPQSETWIAADFRSFQTAPSNLPFETPSLLIPSSDKTIQTSQCSVFVPKGAVVWVNEAADTVSIYDLDDSPSVGSVKVIVDNKPIALSPGTEVVLTRDTSGSFDSLHSNSAIGYRNVRQSHIGDGARIYVCDFSIAHALTNVGAIRRLLSSHDPVERDAARRLLKNATILADLTGFNYKTSAEH